MEKKIPKVVEEYSWKFASQTSDETFSCFEMGKIFDSKSRRLLIGTSQGTIRIFGPHRSSVNESDVSNTNPMEIDKKSSLIWQEERILETKGGAILKLLLHDVTKFGEIDLIVGDAQGQVILFCGGAILSRQKFSDSSIISLAVLNSGTIVSGDQLGTVHSFQIPAQPLQKWRIDEDFANKMTKNLAVSSLVTTKMLTQSGDLMQVVVGCGDSFVHVYAETQRILYLNMPARINSVG